MLTVTYNLILLQALVGKELRFADCGKYLATVVRVAVTKRGLICFQVLIDGKVYTGLHLVWEYVYKRRRKTFLYSEILYPARYGVWLPLSQLLTADVLTSHAPVNTMYLPQERYPNHLDDIEITKFHHRVIAKKRRPCGDERSEPKRVKRTCVFPRLMDVSPHLERCRQRPVKTVTSRCTAPDCQEPTFYTCTSNPEHTFCIHHYRQVQLQGDLFHQPLCPASVYYRDETCYEPLHTNVDLAQLDNELT